MAKGRGMSFHVGPIPVTVDPSFFMIILLLGFLGLNPDDFQPVLLVSWVAIAFASVLFHELGHAVAFRRFGVQPRVTLYGMGGLTSGQGRLTPVESITVSLAGPLSVLLLIGLPALWLQSQGSITTSVGRTILSQVIWINVGWSVLNLIPMLPLDGGNVTMSLLDLVTKGRGRRPAEVVSIVVGIGIGLLAYGYGFYTGALLAGMFVVMNVTSLGRVKQVELGDELQFGQRALIEHRPADAQLVAERVLAQRPSGPTLRWASELLGWARLWQGDRAGAEGAVQRYAHAGAPSGSFRAAQALADGRTAEGVAVMTWAFANEPPGPSQVLGAIAIAGTGQSEAFTSELLRLDGGAGVQAAVLFHGLLDYAGYDREAAQVAAMLAADGRASHPRP
ncbi:MAG: site-2 protease family protein [Acidimicrobiales bacterium]